MSSSLSGAPSLARPKAAPSRFDQDFDALLEAGGPKPGARNGGSGDDTLYNDRGTKPRAKAVKAKKVRDWCADYAFPKPQPGGSPCAPVLMRRPRSRAGSEQKVGQVRQP